MNTFDKKILVLGGTGFIGSYYSKCSKFKKNIFKTSSKQKKGFIKFNLLKDITNFKNIIDKYNINKVILLSAITKPKECFENKKRSSMINVKFTKKIIDILIQKKIYFIFFSSEYIFKGTIGGYSEKTKPNPDLLYGKQKYEVEKYLYKKKSKKFSIFRISKTIGYKKNDKSLFSQFYTEQKKKNLSM